MTKSENVYSLLFITPIVFVFIAMFLLPSLSASAKEKAQTMPAGIEKIVDGDTTCYVTTKTEKATPVAFKYGSISCVKN